MWTRRQFVAASAATALARPALARPPPIPFIDSHVHVWKHDAAFPFAAGANPPAEDASVEMLLALMRANDVARTVLIQVIHYRWDNRYLALDVDELKLKTKASAVCDSAPPLDRKATGFAAR